MTKVARNQGYFVLLLFISFYCVPRVHSARISRASEDCDDGGKVDAESAEAALSSALVILLAAGGAARRTDPLLEKADHGNPE